MFLVYLLELSLQVYKTHHKMRRSFINTQHELGLLTSRRIIIVIRPSSIRYDIMSKLDTRGKFGFEDIDLVEEENEVGPCQ